MDYHRSSYPRDACNNNTNRSQKSKKIRCQRVKVSGATLGVPDAEARMPNPPTLQYPSNVPPVAVFAAARIGGVDIKVVPEKDWPNAAAPTLTFDGGAKLAGIASLLRYIARRSPAAVGLYGTDVITSTLV